MLDHELVAGHYQWPMQLVVGKKSVITTKLVIGLKLVVTDLKISLVCRINCWNESYRQPKMGRRSQAGSDQKTSYEKSQSRDHQKNSNNKLSCDTQGHNDQNCQKANFKGQILHAKNSLSTRKRAVGLYH